MKFEEIKLNIEAVNRASFDEYSCREIKEIISKMTLNLSRKNKHWQVSNILRVYNDYKTRVVFFFFSQVILASDCHYLQHSAEATTEAAVRD